MTDRNRPDEPRRDKVAGGLLLALGVLTLGTAIYFLAIRPPMLPEDTHFTGVAVDVTTDVALVVVDDAGHSHLLDAGDVTTRLP